MFHLAAKAFDVGLQPAARARERIADSHVNVLVLGMNLDVFLQRNLLFLAERDARRRFMAYHQFRSRHTEFDANMKDFAPLVMPVWRFHDHAAARDAIEESVELGSLRFDARRHSAGGLHVAIGDLDRQLHMELSRTDEVS